MDWRSSITGAGACATTGGCSTTATGCTVVICAVCTWSIRPGTPVSPMEVRKRAGSRFGGAAASIGWDKQRRIVFAARHYLMRLASAPPCRFDVISVEGGSIQWMRAAFDAG